VTTTTQPEVCFNSGTTCLTVNGAIARGAIVQHPYTAAEVTLNFGNPNWVAASIYMAFFCFREASYPKHLSLTSNGYILAIKKEPFTPWDRGTYQAYLVKKFRTGENTFVDVSGVKALPKLNPGEIMGEPDGLHFSVHETTGDLCLNKDVRVQSVIAVSNTDGSDLPLTLLNRKTAQEVTCKNAEFFPVDLFLHAAGYEFLATTDKYVDPHCPLYRHRVKAVILANGQKIDLSPYRSPIRSPWHNEKLNQTGSLFESYPRFVFES